MLYSLQSSFKTLTVATLMACSSLALSACTVNSKSSNSEASNPANDKWVPTFQQRTRDEETGWIKGAFYKGLADWAARTNNAEYFEFLKRKAEAVDYALGPRI